MSESFGKIEVGAADGELRLWASQEALKQGNLVLGSQASNLQAAETRASSLLGWIIAGLLAGLAAFITHPVAHGRIFAAALGTPAFVGAILCIVALWPRTWVGQGTDPLFVLDQEGEDDCELNILEAMARGHADAIEDNYRRLRKFSYMMRGAWVASP